MASMLFLLPAYPPYAAPPGRASRTRHPICHTQAAVASSDAVVVAAAPSTPAQLAKASLIKSLLAGRTAQNSIVPTKKASVETRTRCDTANGDQRLKSKCIAIAAAVPLSQEQVRSIIRRQRSLLQTTPEVWVLRWSALKHQLQAGNAKLCELVVQQPLLLAFTSTQARARLSALQSQLHMSNSQLTSMLGKAPQLLSKPVEQVAATAAWLQAKIALDGPGLAAMCLRCPALALVSTQYMADNLQALQQLLEMPEPATVGLVRRFPSLLVCATTSLASKLQALQALLTCSREVALKLAVRQPTLLHMQPVKLREHLLAIEQHLQLDRQQAVQLCVRQPALLALSPHTLAAKVASLLGSCQLPPQVLRGMVLSQPQVLNLAVSRLQVRVQLLREAAAQAPVWKQQLHAWKPSSLAVLLCRNTDVLLRPAFYLHAVEAQPSRALSTLLSLSAEQFNQQYPGFIAWRQQAGEQLLQRLEHSVAVQQQALPAGKQAAAGEADQQQGQLPRRRRSQKASSPGNTLAAELLAGFIGQQLEQPQQLQLLRGLRTAAGHPAGSPPAAMHQLGAAGDGKAPEQHGQRLDGGSTAATKVQLVQQLLQHSSSATSAGATNPRLKQATDALRELALV